MKNDQIVVVILLTAIVFLTNIQHIHSESTNNATDISLTNSQSITEKCKNEGNECQSNGKTEKLLSRRKRYVAFPEGSSFSVTLFTSIYYYNFII